MDADRPQWEECPRLADRNWAQGWPDEGERLKPCLLRADGGRVWCDKCDRDVKVLRRRDVGGN